MEFSVLDACEDAKPEFKNRFGLVMLFDVFHDVAYPNKLIKAVFDMLTDGGKFLVLDVPTHGSLTENIKQAAGKCEINLCIICSHYPFWFRVPYTQEENFHWNSKTLLMANSLNLNSGHHKIFQNISMIAYITGIQKSNFTYI